jgi:hypothetical protein
MISKEDVLPVQLIFPFLFLEELSREEAHGRRSQARAEDV